MNKDATMTGKGCAHPAKKFCDICDLVALRFNSVNIHMVHLNGDPRFIAKDACTVLELTNSRTTLQMLDDDEKGVNLTYTPRGDQDIRVISEPGSYKLIVHSRRTTTPDTSVHHFSNWVFRNVIPGIRRTGTYDTPQGVLQDFSHRREQCQISASEEGRELQACKRKRRELKGEEKTLIREYRPEFYLDSRIQ